MGTINYNHMKYIALFFVTMFTLLSITSCDWTRKQLGMETTEDIIAKKLAHEKAAIEAYMRDSLETVYRDSLNSLKASIEVIDSKGTIKNGDNYHLVVGSFRVHDNATKMVEYLKQNGYPNAFYFDLWNGYRSVSAASYPTVNVAYREMFRLLDKYLKEVDDVWIYKK
jgi:hypothetical protein